MNKNYMESLKGLEILRFFLSISVVIFHYQHFFHPFVSEAQRNLYANRQPFTEVFGLVYTYGYYAVPVFWVISGLIFYKVYKERIAKKQIDFKSYALNRFSRLYPLHVLTLLIVAGLQYYTVQTYGRFFIYQSNSVKNFFQSLFFVQSWGDTKFSFNGPAWSLSVEVFVYMAFYIICAAGLLKKRTGFIILLLSLAMVKKWELLFYNDDIRFCLLLFFVGCGLIMIYDLIRNEWKLQASLFSFLLLAWIFSFNVPQILLPYYAKVTGRLEVDVILFSLTVILGFIMLFNTPVFDKVDAKYFRFFGDMTYSTYMIHFPVSMVMYLVIKPDHFSYFFGYGPFLIYLFSVLVLGRLIYVFFERPLKYKLRRRSENKQAGL